jgi:hypothetical protein
MTLFGKDPEYLEVVAADFLPDGNKLYMLVADSVEFTSTEQSIAVGGLGVFGVVLQDMQVAVAVSD